MGTTTLERPTTKRGRPSTRVEIPPMSEAEIDGIRKGKPPVQVTIKRPNLQTATITIKGITPYVQQAFSEKARKQMEETQRAGQKARGKRNRQPKDFKEVYEAAKHYSKQGWVGIPAPAFRNAMISACRLTEIKMTFAKLSIFVEADGIDRVCGTPLIKIRGEPRIHEGTVRNASGVADIRWRPMWEKWEADVRVTWDGDQFAAHDVVNLMMRAGLQVGIGEGRPDSPKSNGLGWGRFEVIEEDKARTNGKFEVVL